MIKPVKPDVPYPRKYLKCWGRQLSSFLQFMEDALHSVPPVLLWILPFFILSSDCFLKGSISWTYYLLFVDFRSQAGSRLCDLFIMQEFRLSHFWMVQNAIWEKDVHSWFQRGKQPDIICCFDMHCSFYQICYKVRSLSHISIGKLLFYRMLQRVVQIKKPVHSADMRLSYYFSERWKPVWPGYVVPQWKTKKKKWYNLHGLEWWWWVIFYQLGFWLQDHIL